MKNLGLTLLIFILAAAAYGFAETSIADANIPFSFIADGKTYPAGHYRFSTNEPETTIRIDGLKPANTNGVALVVTRLSGRTENTVNLVFDVAGNDHYLSEIHVPNQDGFYFKSAMKKHVCNGQRREKQIMMRSKHRCLFSEAIARHQGLWHRGLFLVEAGARSFLTKLAMTFTSPKFTLSGWTGFTLRELPENTNMWFLKRTSCIKPVPGTTDAPAFRQEKLRMTNYE